MALVFRPVIYENSLLTNDGTRYSIISSIFLQYDSSNRFAKLTGGCFRFIAEESVIISYPGMLFACKFFAIS
jgi:hypothetical protein